ncbi:hypothetical protein [Fimbriiglobus ruber]|uniref:hypothetical protein n=1 Tax=Fimbriiglobus ruber TaxID=1908690 RepID=UPI000B4AD125|nr:hypothetical protein [Fimbriiglobus ruber]
MGRGYIAYQFPDSGREEWVLYSAFLDYRLADGTKLSVDQQPTWCSACNRFVIAESIPTIADLETELARYRTGDAEAHRTWAFISGDAPVAEKIAELCRRIEWRLERQSPSHCLACGASGPVPIPTADEFAHPATGERVVVGSFGWASTAMWVAEFSPEGESLT